MDGKPLVSESAFFDHAVLAVTAVFLVMMYLSLPIACSLSRPVPATIDGLRLAFAKTVIRGGSVSPESGRVESFSLLFPMEVVFEGLPTRR